MAEQNPNPSPEPNPNPQNPAVTPPANPLESPEVQALLAKVRKEEKDKLYAKIQEAESKLDDLTKQVGAKDASLAELQTQLEAVKKSVKGGDKLDLKQLVAEVTAATEAKISEEHAKTLKHAQERLAALEERNRQHELEKLRTKLISESKGNLIEALVRGDTEEELRASIDESRKVWESTVAKVKESLGANPGAVSSSPNSNNSNPSSTPSGSLPNPAPNAGAVTLENVRSMTDEEYRKHRNALLAQTAARYPSLR